MITTRFAPSPTGYIHVGNLRTALMNFLLARQGGGKFILRIDDTDQERSKQEYIDQIKRDLEWLGLSWDESFCQSHRLDLYHETAQKYRDMGIFYECFETPEELDLKRKKQLNRGKPPVYDRSALALSDAERARLREAGGAYWRFMLNQERTNWQDGIQGATSIDTASVSDPVLIRADGLVLYTLASVVDDIEKKITHIVRGADHITNTATQIQMIETLGYRVPAFAHHSLLTGPQGEALSKRIGSLAIKDLREQGAEPMGILSLLASLGSSAPLHVAHSIDELIQGFSLNSFGASPTRFNPEDVTRTSTSWLRLAHKEDVQTSIEHIPSKAQDLFWEMARQNITKRDDINVMWALVTNPTPYVDDADQGFITEAMALLPKPAIWNQTTWKEWTDLVAQKTGRKGKTLYKPLRLALTGQDHGPDMGLYMAVRGLLPKM